MAFSDFHQPNTYSLFRKLKYIEVIEINTSLSTIDIYTISLASSEHKRQCKALFQDWSRRESYKKFPMIAVSKKSIKQLFGVLKNDLTYDSNNVRVQF